MRTEGFVCEAVWFCPWAARLLPSPRDGETVAPYLQTLAVSTCVCFGNLALRGWIKSPKLYRLELSEMFAFAQDFVVEG